MKKLTDPVPSRDVEIKGVNEDFMRAVEDPKVGRLKRRSGIAA